MAQNRENGAKRVEKSQSNYNRCKAKAFSLLFQGGEYPLPGVGHPLHGNGMDVACRVLHKKREWKL